MRKIILFAVGMFMGSFLFGQERGEMRDERWEIRELGKEEFIVPKDPLIAGLLSVQYPGLGQIYCRRYLRGITYFASEIGCFLLATTMAGIETKEYSWRAIHKDEETGEVDTLDLTQRETIWKWDELSGLERTGVVGLILGGIGLHIWNVIDAYHLAQEHNQRLGWLNNIDVKLGFKDNDLSLELAVLKKF